jgi:hypothetical protein
VTIKLANTPQYCAACFNQQPQLRHIDFDAALDRGYGKPEAVQVTMDDAIICENCVKEAGRLLGMLEQSAWTKEKADLERKLSIRTKERDQSRRYADTIESALSHRPEPVRIDHRKKPRHIREQEPA